MSLLVIGVPIIYRISVLFPSNILRVLGHYFYRTTQLLEDFCFMCCFRFRKELIEEDSPVSLEHYFV